MTRKAAQASMESPNLRKSPRNKVKTTNKKWTLKPGKSF
jgi:hypothetical protein